MSECDVKYVSAADVQRNVRACSHTQLIHECLMLYVGLAVRDTIRYDTRCYFNVRSKANISQLNLPHGTDN